MALEIAEEIKARRMAVPEAAKLFGVSTSFLYKFLQGHLTTILPRTERALRDGLVSLRAPAQRVSLVGKHRLCVVVVGPNPVEPKVVEVYERIARLVEDLAAFGIHPVSAVWPSGGPAIFARVPTRESGEPVTALLVFLIGGKPGRLDPTNCLAALALAKEQGLPTYVLRQHRALHHGTKSSKDRAHEALNDLLRRTTQIPFGDAEDLALVGASRLIPLLCGSAGPDLE